MRVKVFLNSKEGSSKLLTFNQNRKGDIYCHWPAFDETLWFTPKTTPNGFEPSISFSTQGKEGKLSLHKDGRLHYRYNDDMHTFFSVIRGNYLLNLDEQQGGVRHLFTISPSKNECFESFGSNDHVISFNVEVVPFQLVFFAVPHTPDVEVTTIQLVEESSKLSELLENNLGMGLFSLYHHDIVWVACRLNDSKEWPYQSCVCYHEGYNVPFFSKVTYDTVEVELRRPTYSVNAKNLLIKIPSLSYTSP